MPRTPKAVSGWTKNQILDFIATNDHAVARALVAIYRRQTADEQAVGQTSEHNARGFGAFDAEFMTDVAKRVLLRGHLTEAELPVVRAKIRKYWRQLIEVANTNDAKRLEAMSRDDQS